MHRPPPAPPSAPAVFLHGVPTCAAVWAPVRSHIGAERDHFAPDLPGYGGTPALEDASVAAHLEWLERWRGAAGLPSWAGVHLVGTDYGALLAGLLASEQGVASLTVCSGALGAAWTWVRATALPPLDRFFYRRFGGTLWTARAATPAHRERWLDAIGGALGRPDLPTWMQRTAAGIPIRRTLGLPRRLRASGVPVALLWGADDRHYPVAFARALGRTLGTDLRLFPGSGHALPFEQPGPVAAALQAFWAGVEDLPGGASAG